MEINLKQTINEEIIKEVLTTAIEGGIGYWSCLRNDHPDWKAANKKWREDHNGEIPCYCDTGYELLSNGKSIFFEDAEAEDEDGEIWELTAEKLANGILKWETWSGYLLEKAIDECRFDSEDADAIIQFALFDEIIYG